MTFWALARDNTPTHYILQVVSVFLAHNLSLSERLWLKAKHSFTHMAAKPCSICRQETPICFFFWNFFTSNGNAGCLLDLSGVVSLNVVVVAVVVFLLYACLHFELIWGDNWRRQYLFCLFLLLRICYWYDWLAIVVVTYFTYHLNCKRKWKTKIQTKQALRASQALRLHLYIGKSN